MRAWILLLITLFFSGCVDVSEVNPPEGERILVVDGFISNFNGPHVVELTQTATYGSVFEGVIAKVPNATVLVRDGQGNIFEFTEIINGTYVSEADFSATPGESYSLLIETSIGELYSSIPQVLPSPVPIEGVEIRATEQPLPGVELYGVFTDPEELGNNYYWIVEGRYPALLNFGGETCIIPETRREYHAIIGDDNRSGAEITTRISFLEDDGFRFTSHYFGKIYQLSVTPEAASFHRRLGSQVAIGGGVFDPPPGKV